MQNNITNLLFGKPPELGHTKENFVPYLSRFPRSNTDKVYQVLGEPYGFGNLLLMFMSKNEHSKCAKGRPSFCIGTNIPMEAAPILDANDSRSEAPLLPANVPLRPQASLAPAPVQD